ncbi:hypothetical protein [Listeria booriae]|uniref:Uncharacterized protein n=1 Tax=Listeria booriae TaxID=1552123 RepID=A0A841ZWT2_9LIST|nr:hypothetical protein [Listeria booriae]MBC1565056.1 hypothetical protein [Listeria booriae]
MNELVNNDKTKEKNNKQNLEGWIWLICIVIIMSGFVACIVFIPKKLAEEDRRNHETVGAYIEANLMNPNEKLLSYTYDKEDSFLFGYELYVVYRSLSDGKFETHSKKVDMGSFEKFAKENREKEKLKDLEKELDNQ